MRIDASPSVEARAQSLAFVQIVIASAAGPAGRAFASIRTDRFVKTTPIHAQIRVANVDPVRAGLPLKSAQANAFEIVDQIQTGPVVGAGIRDAIVDVRVAFQTGESDFALAPVAVYQIDAEAAVFAWLLALPADHFAFVDVEFAVRPVIA